MASQVVNGAVKTALGKDNELGKALSLYSIISFAVGTFGVGVVVFIVIILLCIPLLLLMGSSSDTVVRDKGMDYMNIYSSVVDESIPNSNQAYIDKIVDIEMPDNIIINDFTYITTEMLLVLDTLKYNQEVEKINYQDVLKNAESMMERSYTIDMHTDKKDKKYRISDRLGNLLISDPVKNITYFEVLEEKYPDYTIEQIHERLYFMTTIEIEVKDVIFTFNTLSFDIILDKNNFTEEEKTLAYNYLIFAIQKFSEFTGLSGNVKIEKDSAKYLLPILVDYEKFGEQYIYVTSPFGHGTVQGKPRFHHGVDIGLPVGTQLVATGDGVVTKVGWYTNIYGNYIEITHANGFVSKYGHLSSINVAEGNIVSRGDTIGLSGNTGHSTGPHLHFAIKLNGTAIEPLSLINVSQN
jgi:murein DD-endopeptidase MepM/ murein hydrolase activator NlpD